MTDVTDWKVIFIFLTKTYESIKAWRIWHIPPWSDNWCWSLLCWQWHLHNQLQTNEKDNIYQFCCCFDSENFDFERRLKSKLICVQSYRAFVYWNISDKPKFQFQVISAIFCTASQSAANLIIFFWYQYKATFAVISFRTVLRMLGSRQS